MIRLNAKVNILSSDNGLITTTSDPSDIKNNISVGFSGVIERRVPLTNPFIIGKNKIGDGSTFSKSENYFISKQFADSNGNFATPIEFKIYGDKITAFTIAFDTLNNRYPFIITVDGYTQQNDDATFTVSVVEGNEHTVRIDNWNTPNEQLIITGLYVELAIDINEKNLISFNRKIKDRADMDLPSWGIISNVGNLEFIDTNFEVRDYMEQNLLVAGSKIEITLINTLSNTSEKIGTFYSDTWNYDNDTRVVSVSLKDDLEEWQDILVDEYYSPFPLDLYLIWGHLEEKTPKKWEFEFVGDVIPSLMFTRCKYASLKKGSLWSQFQTLCEIGLFHIYKNNENKVVVKKSM